MSDPLILHLGAHRTASTSTQRALRDFAAGEGAATLAFAGPEILRPRVTQVTHYCAALPLLWWTMTPLALWMARPAAAAVAKRQDRRRVISEEQLLGALKPNLLNKRGIYPSTLKRTRTLRKFLGHKPVRVVLTTRDYADWFVSLYAWAAVTTPLPPAVPLAEEWATRPRGWKDVAADILRVFDDLVVVDYATLAVDPRAILRELAGDAAERIEPRHVGRSLPAEALNQLEARRTAGAKIALEDRAPLLRQHRDAPRLSPFSPEASARLSARYLEDLSAIAAMGARVVTPLPIKRETAA